MRYMHLLALVLVVVASAVGVATQGSDPVRCIPDSPERRGGTGCSIVGHKSVAFEAHGSAWFVVEGEQCLETPDRPIRVKAGETAMVEGGPAMRTGRNGDGSEACARFDPPRRRTTCDVNHARRDARSV